ncbi:MAG: hypothetical protein DCC67_11015 [Planctomycetota bacterium]|nr:MAG: hypothetical protein DCC67_11015 [Planctomycetota bacterium]
MCASGDNELYGQASAAFDKLQSPRQSKPNAALPLLATIALFAVSILWMIGSASTLAFAFLGLLIAVLLLHEAGHYLGMRLFGYRDVRMFFIPFFGAAVAGEQHAAPAWQQATVLLLGPLPGIALGAAIGVARPEGWTGLAAYLLLLVNGLNLLPFVPLDGGKLLQLLVFARHPSCELVFLLVSGLGLIAVGWMEVSWVFGGLGLAVSLSAPWQYRRRLARLAGVRELGPLPPQLPQLTEDDRRSLFRAARAVKPRSYDSSEIAGEMKTLHEVSATRPAGALPTIGLLSLYLAGVAAALTFDPFGVTRGVANLSATPMVGRIAGVFEFSDGQPLALESRRGETTRIRARQGYRFIGVTFQVEGDKTLVPGDYVVVDRSGGEFLPLGISNPSGGFYRRDYVRRVELHRDLNFPVTFGSGGVSQLALPKPAITLLYEVPARDVEFHLHHNSMIYDFRVPAPQPKPR